jgi:hypothetical protein
MAGGSRFLRRGQFWLLTLWTLGPVRKLNEPKAMPGRYRRPSSIHAPSVQARQALRHSPARSAQPRLHLELTHKRHQGFLLLLIQLQAQDEVEELHRILERQESPIVQVGG